MNDGIDIKVNTWLTHNIEHFEDHDRIENFLHLFDRLSNGYLRQAQQQYEIIFKIQNDEINNQTNSSTTTLPHLSSFITTDITTSTWINK
jgi:hypothetical protein